MSKSLRPLTPELQQAFYQAVMECKGWQADPEEPEVYVYDQIHRIKISSVCNDVIACENKPMPEETLGGFGTHSRSDTHRSNKKARSRWVVSCGRTCLGGID